MADRGRLSIGHCIKAELLFFNETKVGCLHKDNFIQISNSMITLI